MSFLSASLPFHRREKTLLVALVLSFFLLPLSLASAVGYHVEYCTASGRQSSMNVNGPPSKIEAAAASVGATIKTIDPLSVAPGGGAGNLPFPDYIDLISDPTLGSSDTLGVVAADLGVIIVSRGDPTFPMQVARLNGTTGFLEVADLPLTSLDFATAPLFAESAVALGDNILPAFHDPLDPTVVVTADFELIFTHVDLLGNVVATEQVPIDLGTLAFRSIPEPSSLLLGALAATGLLVRRRASRAQLSRR